MGAIGLKRVLACAACLGALLAAPASAADWKSVGLGAQTHFNSVSCPALGLCVAVGTNSTFAVATLPAGEAGAWSVSSRPQSGKVDGDLRAVECPSPSLCVAIEASGAVLTTSNPMGGAAAWAKTEVPGSIRLSDLSCPRVSRCVAVGDDGLVVTSGNPTAGAAAWSGGPMDPPRPRDSVACTAAARACGSTAGSAIASTTDLTSGAAAWELEGEAPGTPLSAVDCPSDGFCAIGAGGAALTTASPTGPISGWTRVAVPTGFQLPGLDCQAPGRCVASTDGGELFAMSSPGPWVEGRLVSGRPGGLYDVSCPSLELCVAVGEAAQIASSTDPFAAPAAPAAEEARPKPPRTVVFGKHSRRLRLRNGKQTAGIRFHFTANGIFTGFACRIDRRPYRRCADPKSYSLALGAHVFKVRAIGPGGIDRTPGVIRVRVIEAHRRGGGRPPA